VRLHLCGRFPGDLGIELIARGRTFGLVDRHGLTAIGEAIGLAEKDIRDLIGAECGD
jgi:hypothetical protein